MDLIFLKSLRSLYCDYISRILCVRRAQQGRPPRPPFMYFYSRPYARGNKPSSFGVSIRSSISTHAPTRGATRLVDRQRERYRFLLTPLREGRHAGGRTARGGGLFLLPPLREGQQGYKAVGLKSLLFLLTPLREGRRPPIVRLCSWLRYFYSRPYARGDTRLPIRCWTSCHFYSRPYVRGDGTAR